MKPIQTAFATLTLLAAASTQAASVLPTSYDMPNGYGQASGGSFNYWDRAYTGSGNTQLDFAPLSGGLGDLTDGVIATERWDMVENVAGTGPYVGWLSLDPVITFHFASALQFTEVTVWHDDANGYGNVATPQAFVVTVGSQSQTFNITDRDGDTPFASTLLLGPGFVGSSLQLQVVRYDSATMLSEVSFQAAAVPEPATWAMWALGAAVLVQARRRRAVA
jgi:hypothetical protein